MNYRFKLTPSKCMVILTIILELYPGKTTVVNLSFHFELNGHQWKSTSSRFDNSPLMSAVNANFVLQYM